ncbi:hypothetical protein [Micromonospora echinofusca]|uniref:Uncharacterized protein n=1 Tax=Micromonospora echinofusca TaxID=47858 RepID=A0ABS3VZM3_MICEH|nr:hypothetical protein [Micromonospora echinofusca]MBO4209969.1 hypothetical protein [Micromonospora echinofusca]
MDAVLLLWMVGCPALVALVVAGLVLLAVQVRKEERERRNRWQLWAARYGWTYAERPQVDWTDRVPGRNRRGVRFAMTGILHGRPVEVAEYAYTTSHTTTDANGSSQTTSHTHPYVVCSVLLRRPFPQLAVVPRDLLSKLGRALSGSYPEAIGVEAFDRQWRLVADSPAERALVGPALVAAHLAGAAPAWSVRGTRLITYRSGQLTEPGPVRPLLDPLVAVADLLEQGR